MKFSHHKAAHLILLVCDSIASQHMMLHIYIIHCTKGWLYMQKYPADVR